MIYSKCFFSPTLIILSYFFYLFNFNFKTSLYLFYVIQLNTWYFNFFFCFIFFTVIFNLIVKKSINYMFVLIMLFKLNFDFWFFFKTNNFIPSLMTGTVSIHPLFFYIFIIFFITNQILNNRWLVLIKIPFNMEFFFVLGFLTLFLGGLWGLQSLTWGFLWVNDSIEWLLSFFLLYLGFKLHKLFKSTEIFYSFYLFLYLTYLFLLRLNFIASRHSFLSNQKIYVFIFFIFWIILLQFFINLKNKKTCKYDYKFLQISWYFYLISTNFYVYNIIFRNIFFFLFISFINVINWRVKKILHFSFFFFGVFWVSYYYIFFFNFSFFNHLFFKHFNIFENVYQLNHYFYNNLNKTVNLELVSFFINLNKVGFFNYFFHVTFINFNHLKGIVLCVFLLLFKMGWI